MLLLKKGNNITPNYCKGSTNDIYANWNSFAPTTWKKEALNTLVDRAYITCSNIALEDKEIDHVILI